MKPTSLFQPAHLFRRAGVAQPRFWLILAAAALVVASGLTQAAPVSAPTETQTDTPTNAETARVGVSTGGKVLDKAVQGGVSTGSRNLDLLLEMHRSDAAQGGKPASNRVDATDATLPGKKPSSSQVGNREHLPSLSQNPLLGSDVTGAQQRAELLQAKRDWLGEGSSSSESAVSGRRKLQAEAVARDVNAGGGDGGVTRLMPLTLIQFLQDNRVELLIGVVLLVLVAAGLKAYSRRV